MRGQSPRSLPWTAGAQPDPGPSWGWSHRMNSIKCWAKRKAHAKETHEQRSCFLTVRKSAFGVGHRPRASVCHLKPNTASSPASIFFLCKWFLFLKIHSVIQCLSGTQSVPPGVAPALRLHQPLVTGWYCLCSSRVLQRTGALPQRGFGQTP